MECVLNHVWLCDPIDCSPPASSVHGVFQARILEWLPFPPPGDLPNPGIEPVSLVSPALAGCFFTSLPPGSPYTWVPHCKMRRATLPGVMQLNSMWIKCLAHSRHLQVSTADVHMIYDFVKSVFSFLGEETGAHKTESECLWKICDE